MGKHEEKNGASGRPLVGRGPNPLPPVGTQILFYFILFYLFGGMRYLGRMGIQYTHFFKCPPTLGSVKSSIPHKVWRFYFFGNFIFPKFRVDLDLHTYRSDFHFMENGDH
jgi:hypothetical protein